MPKPAPVYDIRFVLHPEQDTSYVHFENGSSHPFQPDASSLSRVNVWWMAEAALLSYWDPAEAIPIFRRTGLQADFIQHKDTDCYLAWDSSFVIVAFRGTESDRWPDVLTDVKIAQVPWRSGQVHHGFSDALRNIWPKLTARLDPLASTRTVWFCGHSLGAALATLAADLYDKTHGVCTFGCPRVGDPAFAEAFAAKLADRSLRYVNDHDVVTHVPTPFLFPWAYRHVTARRFIDPAGQVSTGEPALAHFFDDLIGAPKALLDIVNAQRGASSHAPVFLLDHMPRAYAIWTWNDYEAHG